MVDLKVDVKRCNQAVGRLFAHFGRDSTTELLPFSSGRNTSGLNHPLESTLRLPLAGEPNAGAPIPGITVCKQRAFIDEGDNA
jgi:hypothetical protein